MGSSFDSLIRTASGLRETFHCHICQEIQPVGEESMKLVSCKHHIHRECWCAYITHDIMNKQGQKPTCFKPVTGEDGEEGVCGAEIDMEDMRNLVSEETFQKYESFAMSHADPAIRTCSKCGHSQALSPPPPPNLVVLTVPHA